MEKVELVSKEQEIERANRASILKIVNVDLCKKLEKMFEDNTKQGMSERQLRFKGYSTQEDKICDAYYNLSLIVYKKLNQFESSEDSNNLKLLQAELETVDRNVEKAILDSENKRVEKVLSILENLVTSLNETSEETVASKEKENVENDEDTFVKGKSKEGTHVEKLLEKRAENIASESPILCL